MNLEPDLVELTTRGITAVRMLEAQKRLSNACVEQVLKKIDSEVAGGRMTSEKAVGFVHEIAAYRQIIYHQMREISNGKGAERRLAEAQ